MEGPVKEDWRWKYAACDFYVDPPSNEEWSKCPKCGVRPRVWVFDNGRYAKCCCVLDKYKGADVTAQSIMASMRHNGPTLFYYDSDALRKNWNFHVIQENPQSAQENP